MTALPRRRVLSVLLAAAGALALPGAGVQAQTATAPPPEVAAEVPAARLLGSGPLRFLGMRIYDSRLWAGASAPGADWTGVPYALELQYARGLSGERIAERSLDEMKRQGVIADADGQRWLARMKQLFPDVKEGDRITGVNVPGSGAKFFLNGQLRGEVMEVEFARRFFGIWLAPQTSEPALRDTLLGRKPS